MNDFAIGYWFGWCAAMFLGLMASLAVSDASGLLLLGLLLGSGMWFWSQRKMRNR
jgi:hypothetical protein